MLDSPKNRTLGFLALAAGAAFLARVSNAPWHLSRLMNSDAALFLSEARAALAGGPPLDPLWPPLYPLAAAWLGRSSGDLEIAALTLTLIAGSLICVPVYFLGREMFGVATACFGAAACVCVFPLVFWSCQAYPETLFILALYSLLSILWTPGPRALGARYGLAGILAGTAYLLRPEGALFVPLGALWIWLDPERGLDAKQRRLAIALLVAGFLAFAAPYLIRLHAQLGHWALSGKAGWNLLAGDRALGADYDRLAWSLTADGREIASERAMREQTLLGVAASRPFELTRRYVVNSARLAIELVDALGLPLTALAIAGLIASWRERRRLAFVALACAPIAAIPLFFVNVRFFLFALPALLLLAGRGAHWAALKAVPVEIESYRRITWAVLFALALMPHLRMVTAVAVQGPEVRSNLREGDEYLRVGEWMRKNCPPFAKTTNVWVAYYSGLTPVQIPYGDAREVLSFLRSRGCEFLVVDRRNGIRGWLPESSAAFAPLLTSPPPGELEEVYRWQARPEHEVRVFKIRK